METQQPGKARGRGARAHLLAFTAVLSSVVLAASTLGVVLAGPLQSSIEGQPVQVAPSASPIAPVPEPAVTAPAPSPSPEVAAADIFTAPTITILPPPPPPSTGSSSSSSHQSTPAMLAFVNAQRAAAGLNALTWSTSLASLAQGWSNKMAASDDSVTGDYCREDIDLKHGDTPSPGGQNVACNFATSGGVAIYGYYSWSASLVVADAGWMASPDHRANILNPAWTRMGGGGKQSAEGVWYWTENFQ